MKLLTKILLATVAAIPALFVAHSAWSIEPDEVRPYDEVFAISAKAEGPQRVTVAWDIAENYFLYNNRFLAFEAITPGVVLGEPDIPAGKKVFDELLGEDVIKFRDRLEIGVPLLSVPSGVRQLELEVRSQGCLESVLCYPPSRQFLAVDLPAGLNVAPGPAASPARSPLEDLLGMNAPPMGGGAPALPPDQAFVFEAIALNAGTILARFTAQPGYYLYVANFDFSVVGSDAVQVGSIELPPGTIKDDPEFGLVPVIFDQVEIPVHLNRPAGDAVEVVLQASWQGCRDGDICYPPQTGRLSVSLPAAGVDFTAPQANAAPAPLTAPVTGPVRTVAPPPVSEQGRLATLLIENPPLALLAFFVAGLLLAFTPCVFPMVPILSGIIAGEGDNITTTRALTLSVVYVLAMALTYTAAGVLAGLFGQNLQAMFQSPWIIGTFAGVFVLLALSMFGFYELQLPSSWQTKLTEQSNQQQGGRLGGVAVMGLLSALIVGPCVAPPLAAALIVIGESGSAMLGGSALFAMSLGMGVPLIAVGIGAGKFLPRAGKWMNAVKAVFGVGLLALAIWMLERILPGAVIMVLWGLLAIASAVYLGALERVAEGASGWARLWKALGVTLLLFGAMQLIGAASGGDYWLRPLDHLAGGGSAGGDKQEKVEFRRIASLEDLQAAVAQANAQGRPAMLDFYADWCVECIRMERNTFPAAPVQDLLARLQPIKADVTENNPVDQRLMKEFGIYGPPAILFFGLNGEEMKDYRLVGYFDAETFSAHLQQVLAAQ